MEKENILVRIVEEIKDKYQDDIALLCYYGSQVDGTQYAKSDLDMYFVPKNERGCELCHQFIIDDIGYDLYPLSWERLEKMSRYDEEMVSLLLDAKIYYSDGEESKEKFYSLQENLKHLFGYKNRRKMLEKAGKKMNDSFAYLHNIYVAEEICEARYEAALLLETIFHALAYVNQTYYHKGAGKNMVEVYDLALLPNHFKESIESIMYARKTLEVKTYSLVLVNGVESLIENELIKMGHRSVDHYKGFFEELLSTFNKLDYACECKNYDLAYFSAYSIVREVSAFLTFENDGYWPMKHQQFRSYSHHFYEAGFKDLLCYVDPNDFDRLKMVNEELKEQIIEYLDKLSIRLVKYQEIKDLFSH